MSGPVIARRAAGGVLVLFAALGLAAELACFVRPDMSFLLYAAGRVLDGARLYRDVVEINPPLIIAVNLPAVVLSRWLGLDAVLVYRLLTVAVMAASLVVGARLIRRATPGDERLALGLVILSGFVLFLMPGIDFGQREHLLLALVLPYVLGCMARSAGRPAAPALGVVIGLLAGIGLALKPQFVLLWLALEGYLALRSPRRWPRMTVESAAVAGVLMLYGLGIVLLTPDYLPMVRLLGRAYYDYLRSPFLEVFVTAPGFPLCLTAGLALAALVRRSRYPDGAAILGLAMGSSYLAGAIQVKGFTYHFYPASAFAILLLGHLAFSTERPRTRAERLYAAVTAASLATAVLLAIGWAVVRIAGADPVDQRNRKIVFELRDAIRRHADTGSVLVFSNNIGSIFPLVPYSGLAWASRFPHLWILGAEYQDQLLGPSPIRYRARGEMDAAERYLNDAVYEDLRRWRPVLLLVLRPAADRPPNLLRRLDYLAYFSADPRIAALLRGYTFVEESGEYDLYRRVEPGAVPSAPPASAPGTLDVLQPEARGARALLADPNFLAATLLFLVFLLPAWAAAGSGRGRGP